MKKLFIILAAVAMIFAACKKSDSDNDPVNPNPTPTLSEQLVGKWLYIEADGALVETIESSITDFVMEDTTLTAYTSISIKKYGVWAYKQLTEVTIEGDTITLTMQKDNITTVEVMTNIIVDGDNLRYTSNYTILRDGEVVETYGPYQLRCVKVHDDYSEIIIGRWEGFITCDEQGYEPQPFCEKYLTDGTNIEYQLVDGEWKEVEVVYAYYFVDGNLLCTRWQYPGSREQRENSIFMSYENDTLIVKEVVSRNGQLYTEISTLVKVSE